MGHMTGTLFGGLILHDYPGEWELVFYIFGGLGLAWCLVWQFVGYSGPLIHPCITKKELEFLNDHIGQRREKLPPPPLKKIFTSVPVWSLVICQFTHDWVFFTLNLYLPKYMKDILRFPIKQVGLILIKPRSHINHLVDQRKQFETIVS